MQISYSSKFARSFKKLPYPIKKQALAKEFVFRKDPFTESLRTHKLSGRLSGFWAFSITYSHRILFEFMGEDKARFHDIDDHDIYR